MLVGVYMFEIQVTDYLGTVHTLQFVTEPSEEQKQEIIYSHSLEYKQKKDKEDYFKRCDHGKYIAEECAYLLSSKNIELNKSNTFIDAMMTNVIPVKNLLEVGSLNRSRQIIVQLQAYYGADYTAIFQDAIDDIDNFKG
jgi:hypothetical protein